MEQPAPLDREVGLLRRRRRDRVDLADLEIEQVEPRRAVPVRRLHRLERLPRRLPAGRGRRRRFEVFLRSRERVEQVERRVAVGQLELGVLPVNGDEALPEASQRADRGRLVLDERAPASVGRELPSQEQVRRLGKPGLARGSRAPRARRELAGDDEFRGALPDEVRRSPPAGEQRHRVHEDGLAGARFAGDDGEPVLELELQVFDDREILDRQAPQHARSLARPRAGPRLVASRESSSARSAWPGFPRR